MQSIDLSIRPDLSDVVPINSVFEKMTRIVPALACVTGKQIELTSTGGETLLDRKLVEALGDPLIHMISNAADHGIETPEERSRAGKLPIGKISCRAYHSAGTVVLELCDDGRGLDTRRILRKAIENGIVTTDDAPRLSEQQVFSLIFHLGLSTSERMNGLSGLGVGMDVVKRNVESLRGRIETASILGVGTTFTIRLPLTATVTGGLIELGGPVAPVLTSRAA